MPNKLLRTWTFYFAISAAGAAAPHHLGTSHKSPASTPVPASIGEGNGDVLTNEAIPNDSDVVAVKPEKPTKDWWDKLYSASAVIVAAFGFYATRWYSRRQRISEEHRKDQELLLSQLQTVEKFMPHLSSNNEQVKSAALVIIDALGNRDLAIKLARAFAGPGATRALTKIASISNRGKTPSVEEALIEVFGNFTPRIVTLYSGSERRAHGFLVREGLLVTTANAVADVLASGLAVSVPGGQRLSGKIEKIDRLQDLALVTTPYQEALAPLDTDPSMYRIGDTVMALSLSPEGKLRLRTGQVIPLDIKADILVGSGLLRDASGRIAVKLMVQDSEIGAPVFDGDGRILGLVEARNKEKDITFLIPIAEAFKFARIGGASGPG